MDIKAIEEYVQAANKAYDNGILRVWDNEIHVTIELFEKLLNEEGNLEVVKHEGSEYPIQTSLTINELTYFSLLTEKEFENIFGGNIDECITTK
ncbi:hypothetical protein B4087_1137 [Bacillus cereus]|uniref:hypothetical protein n=1 Tax=Bacillus cereus TaxID=1396 RepID=UPI00062D40DD|nr:hypothetical protein [Bacillus cereus]KLA16187.1 hypothetical protein B4087_1137 [Bacillus cereus]KMP68392.1 threonyl-tRNA synthetase [Bacillus cereus]